MTTHNLCLSHKPSKARGFVWLIWVWYAHFQGIACHRFGKTALWCVTTEPVGRWQRGLRFQDSLYWGRAPLHRPPRRMAVSRFHLLHCFPRTGIWASHRAARCLGAFSPWRHCLCSFPSLALSRTNVAGSPSIKHTIRREGIHFTITQATTHLQSVPNFAFCTVTIWPLGKKKRSTWTLNPISLRCLKDFVPAVIPSHTFIKITLISGRVVIPNSIVLTILSTDRVCLKDHTHPSRYHLIILLP